MRTLVQGQDRSSERGSPGLVRPGAVTSGTAHPPQSILHLQRTLGNQAVSRLLQAKAAEGMGVPRARVQRACACAGGCSKCQSDPERDRPAAPHESDGLAASEPSRVRQRGDSQTLRRQTDEDKPDPKKEKEMEELGKKIEPRSSPAFGEAPVEPDCPKDVQLGKIKPDPPCAVDLSPASDEGWQSFEFCQGSDAFRDRASAGRIRQLARDQPALTRFVLHAYASIEGRDQENANLSCHRARRVERELLNAGVLPENVEIAGKGKTSKFDVSPGNPNSEKNLRANRRVVLNADTSKIPPKPALAAPEPEPADITPKDKLRRFQQRQRQMVDTAVATLTGGHYRLAADAYMSRWTCGEFRTLRDAVARTEVRIEGEPAIGGSPEVGGLSAGDLGTETEKEPLDIVILNQAMFSTVDPVGCLIARIIDLTFHLKARPHLASKSKRHNGGLFLVELAGFLPCLSSDSNAAGGVRYWFEGERPAVDPLAEEPLPSCAERPLEGAWVSEKEAKKKGHDLGGKAPLDFKAEPLAVTDSAVPADFRFDLESNRAFLGTPGEKDGKPQVIASTTVAAVGDATLFPRYRLGFIRTVQADELTAEYVNGFQLRRSPPTPLRDGSTGDPAPWFGEGKEPGASSGPRTAAPPNPPQLEFPFAILTHPFVTARAGEEKKAQGAAPSAPAPLPAVDQTGRTPVDPLAENVLNRVKRNVQYTLWIAARRQDAPLDHPNTRFLQGQLVTVLEEVDVGIGAGGRVQPSGKTTVKSQGTALGLESFARLSGPVPAAFAGGPGPDFGMGDKRIVTRDLPQDRDTAPGGLDPQEYQQRVLELTQPIRQELGLTQALSLRILIDQDSGRMRVPGISSRRGTGLGEAEPVMSLPVQALVPRQGNAPGPFAPRSVLDTFAERFYLQGRKELVLRRGTSLQEQKLGGSLQKTVDLPALSGVGKTFPHLHQIPAALSIFREVWTEFAKDCRLERSATIIADRRNGKLRRELRVGSAPRVEGGQVVHAVNVCAGADTPLNVHETVLGAVHTHPKGIAPSINDYNLVRELEGLGPLGSQEAGPDLAGQLSRQRVCGNELYTLLRDANGDVIAIRMGVEPGKDEVLGPILGNLPGC